MTICWNYLALAEQHGARLITDDDALDKVARNLGDDNRTTIGKDLNMPQFKQ